MPCQNNQERAELINKELVKRGIKARVKALQDNFNVACALQDLAQVKEVIAKYTNTGGSNG